jgi:hypothetical protein
MKLTFLFTLFSLSLLLSSTVSAATHVVVETNGTVESMTLADDAHLADLLTHSNIPADTYWPTARIATPASQAQVDGERQALLHDLEMLEYQWHNEGETQKAYAVRELRAELAAVKLIGRLPATLDPDWVRIRPEDNPQLQGDYRLVLPARPTTLMVLGLINGNPRPLLKSKQVIADYIDAECLPGGECSWGYFIQNDGTIEKVGLEYWNRQHREADPGAVLFIGFDNDQLPEQYRDLNSRIAHLLTNRIAD